MSEHAAGRPPEEREKAPRLIGLIPRTLGYGFLCGCGSKFGSREDHYAHRARELIHAAYLYDAPGDNKKERALAEDAVILADIMHCIERAT